MHVALANLTGFESQIHCLQIMWHMAGHASLG
jgi:hypothetical protein